MDNIIKNEQSSQEFQEDWIFSDLSYVCDSNKIIIDALRKGCDVAQLPNGDLVVTEVRTITIRYIWDKNKQKLVKIAQE